MNKYVCFVCFNYNYLESQCDTRMILCTVTVQLGLIHLRAKLFILTYKELLLFSRLAAKRSSLLVKFLKPITRSIHVLIIISYFTPTVKMYVPSLLSATITVDYAKKSHKIKKINYRSSIFLCWLLLLFLVTPSYGTNVTPFVKNKLLSSIYGRK